MQVLGKLGKIDHPALLSRTDSFEDAAVYRLDAERALVQTLDFFPPIVDDPRWFGRIAAANALSDVFAMGGTVLTAMNIVGWPAELDHALLAEVLAGGLEKVQEAGGALCGGHSVRDHEVKYGLAVTGLVHPERFWRNAGARVGDVLVLTKPLGMGTVSTAIKKEFLAGDDEAVLRAMEQMARLNADAVGVLRDFDVHAATDVTGYGLMGHLREMADGAGVSVEVEAAAVPIFAGALELAGRGAVSGGGKRARAALGARVALAADLDPDLVAMLFDAETSGGLLVALPAVDADRAVASLTAAGCLAHDVIGRVVARGAHAVRVG